MRLEAVWLSFEESIKWDFQADKARWIDLLVSYVAQWKAFIFGMNFKSYCMIHTVTQGDFEVTRGQLRSFEDIFNATKDHYRGQKNFYYVDIFDLNNRPTFW